jgi:hypothetical protein
MGQGKNYQVWLSGELQRKAVDRITRDHEGNEADYLRALVERDTDPGHVLEQLSQQYWPAATDALRGVLKEYTDAHPEFSQSSALAYFLDALQRAAKENRDLMRPFEIMTLSEKLDYKRQFDEQQATFKRSLEILAKRLNAPELLHQLNEPGATPKAAEAAPAGGETGGRGKRIGQMPGEIMHEVQKSLGDPAIQKPRGGGGSTVRPSGRGRAG